MLFDDITLIEGADISNLSVNSGTFIDRNNLLPTNGEIFYQTDNDPGFYTYTNSAWSKIGTSGELTAHVLDSTIHIDSTQNTLLDGITVTFDKINYLTNVTSDIQTQLNLKSDLSNVLLKDGSVELTGTLLPEMTGSTGNISVRNLGSSTKQFSSIYANEMFVGANSLYVNNKKVIKDDLGITIFTSDLDNNIAFSAIGTGTLDISTDTGILSLTSTQNIVDILGTAGINLSVDNSLITKHINISNASTNGNIVLTTTGSTSEIQLNAISTISLTATTLDLNGTISTDTYADLDSTISTISTNLTNHNHDSSYVNRTGDTLTGSLTLAGNPTQDNHAASKAYVDSVVTGLDTKQSVRLASEVNLSLTGTLTVDGVITLVGDRILVKAQTDQTQNGIYIVSSIGWSRSIDADNTPSNEVSGGMYTFVEEGTTNADTGWILTNITGNAILGTDNLIFTKFTNVTAPVSSVNGKTGAVSLTKSDIGLNNVENTTDLDKVISNLTQTALDNKLNQSVYTAADILSKLLTVDGSGSGLDADTIRGLTTATNAFTFTADTLVRRDISGHIYSEFLNMSSNVTTVTPSHLAVETSNDGFLRWQTPSQFITNMNILTTSSVIDGGTF